MKHQKHQIHSADMAEWEKDQRVCYASSVGVNQPHLAIYVTLEGLYIVELNRQPVYQGQSRDRAVAVYNDNVS